MGILVFRYGLRPPVEGADEVERQMRATHALRNELTEIERGRRAAVREVLRASKVVKLESSVAELRAKEETVERALQAARVEGRTSKEIDKLRDALRAARDASKNERDRLFAARRKVRSTAKIAKIEGLARALRKDAYRLAQDEWAINWGGRWLAETAVDSARRKLLRLFEGDGVTPLDPRFKRWDGSGQITIQLTGKSGEKQLLGLATTDVTGDHPRLRIGPATLVPRPDGQPRKGKTDALRTLWIRVGSGERGAPVWAKFPMRMHRPLPTHGVIKRATVSRTMNGPRAEWTVEITVDTSLVRPRERCGVGAVAVHFGWRAMRDGLRVATWCAEDGDTGHFILEADVIGAIRKVDELRAVRDREFNEQRRRLEQWIAQRRIPDWLREATATIDQWRSCARLSSLSNQWRRARFEGDEGGFELLEAWRYRDHHKWSWESNQRAAGARYRRDIYRKFAASLARRYGALILETFDLKRVGRRAPPESGDRDVMAGRGNRVVASVGELRVILQHAFNTRGGEVVWMPAAPVTSTCHACGAAQDFDAVEQLVHACRNPKCGAVWDQDDNAAANILATHLRARGGGRRSTARSRRRIAS